MYIDFDEYPPYSAPISDTFVTNVNTNSGCDHVYTYLQAKRKFPHGLMIKVGK